MVWDFATREKTAVLTESGPSQSDVTCFSIGKNSFVSGSSDCTVCLWNMQ